MVYLFENNINISREKYRVNGTYGIIDDVLKLSTYRLSKHPGFFMPDKSGTGVIIFPDKHNGHSHFFYLKEESLFQSFFNSIKKQKNTSEFQRIINSLSMFKCQNTYSSDDLFSFLLTLSDIDNMDPEVKFLDEKINEIKGKSLEGIIEPKFSPEEAVLIATQKENEFGLLHNSLNKSFDVDEFDISLNNNGVYEFKPKELVEN